MSNGVEERVGIRTFGRPSRRNVSVGDHLLYDTGEVSSSVGGKLIAYVEVAKVGFCRIFGANGVSFPYHSSLVLTQQGETLAGRKLKASAWG